MLIFKAFSAIAAAAFGAALVLLLPGVSPEADASTTAAAPLAKGDRLDIRPVGTACSEQAWPYFGAGCLRGSIPAHNQARTVRMVTTDRISVTLSK